MASLLCRHDVLFTSSPITPETSSTSAKMQNRFLLLSTLMGAASVTARDIPSNVKTFVDSIKSKGTCSNKLATGFYAKDSGPNSMFTLSCACPSVANRTDSSLLLLRRSC